VKGVLIREKQHLTVTQTHNVKDKDEAARIERYCLLALIVSECEGAIFLDRVGGSLAVGRAFGDFEFKTMASKLRLE